MPRVFVITLAYNTAPMMRASLERFEATFGIPWGLFEHIYINQHYPVGQSENALFLAERAQKPGSRVLDPGRNLGLHKGFNFALQAIGPLEDDDVIIGFDPDCFPQTFGWGAAMRQVLRDKSVGWASCWTPHTERETKERGFKDSAIHGVEVRRTKAACLNSVCAWSGRFMKASKGLTEHNPYYGGLECVMFPKLAEIGLSWVFMKEFLEEIAPAHLIDPHYRTWKWETTHGGKPQIEFGEWLREKGILRESAG